jgi:hypothetical protein
MLDLAVNSKAKICNNNNNSNKTSSNSMRMDAVAGDDLHLHDQSIKDHDDYAEKNSNNKINFSWPKALYFR